MSDFTSPRIAVAGLLACMSVWCPRLFSQSNGASQRESQCCPCRDQAPSERSKWLGAQNRWQLTPVDVNTQSDNATPELRAKRNSYLKPLLEEAKAWREPEGLPPGEGVGWNEGAVDGNTPEVSIIQHAVWVIAKFESFHVLAADRQYRLIYTEINFRVTQVLRQPLSLSLAPGSLLDSMDIGGRIKRPDGSVASFPILPSRHSYQPGGTYLLQGTYDATREYFRMNNWWDVSSGKVVPGTILEIDRAAKGNSRLNGLTIAEAAQYLDSVLPVDSN